TTNTNAALTNAAVTTLGVCNDPSTGTAVAATTRIWTSESNWHTYGISCRPIDLDVCKRGGAGGGAACTSDATRAVDQYMTLLIVFSTGKNGARTATYGTDETENTDNDGAFV